MKITTKLLNAYEDAMKNPFIVADDIIDKLNAQDVFGSLNKLRKLKIVTKKDLHELNKLFNTIEDSANRAVILINKMGDVIDAQWLKGKE